MQKVSKNIWDVAIHHENMGWSFNDKKQYMHHEIGNLHGQIVTYAKYMRLFEDFGMSNAKEFIFDYNTKLFDMKNMTIIDQFGGPSSLLLRCTNFKKAIVVDPGEFPDYITNRYKENNIEVVKLPAEEFKYPEKADLTLFYNALAHCFDPYTILLNAKNNSKEIRLIECLNAGINIQHPQNLTQEELEHILGVKGNVVDTNEPEPSPRGLHFYGVWNF
jgi:hypothetical protein